MNIELIGISLEKIYGEGKINKMKTAIVTGCLGQDGSYLVEYLRSLDYHVVGITRRRSSDALSYGFLSALRNDPHFELYHGDITDPVFITDLLCKYFPDEYYNLAAQSHVHHSFSNPIDTFNIDALAVVNVLSLIEKHSRNTKFYQASTSELFGGLNCPFKGYTEESPLYPRSPYGVAKLAAHWATINFKEAYGLYACAGILFNHGSPRRGLDFIERKITNTVAKIKLRKTKKIVLGNLDAYRDLGHSKDYVKAQHLMLQQDVPQNYIIATGKTYQIKDIVTLAFKVANINYPEDYIEFDERFLRPSEVPYLLGNPEKALNELSWKPDYNLETLIEEMYRNDLELEKR